MMGHQQLYPEHSTKGYMLNLLLCSPDLVNYLHKDKVLLLLNGHHEAAFLAIKSP